MQNPKQHYEKRKEFYARQAADLFRRINRLSNLRLILFLAGLGLGVFLYLTYSHSLGMGLALLTLILFAGLVLWQQSLKSRHLYRQTLRENYEQSLQRLAGEWKSFPDRGEDFQDARHPYAEDLDLFGVNSLFQWLNTAQTFKGREKLKAWLTTDPGAREEILRRQEAVRELAGNLSWRQRFLAEARMAKGIMNSPQGIIDWAGTYDKTYLQVRVLILARALPLVTISFLLIYLLTGKLSFWYPLLGIVLQALILFMGKQRGKALRAVYTYKENIKIYEKMLARFERRSFRSEYLRNLKQVLPDRAGTPAFAQIRKLAGITEMIANRDNAVFLIVNILTLWDIQCMIALESWKEKSGRLLGGWLETIGELEALASLAGIHFDHPDWAFPEISGADAGIIAAGMGHPLLRGAVCNDLRIDRQSGILLITGSNMSGKSTLLRTTGINLVLAYAGAPVYAQGFSCSGLRLYTCMRVSDNLGESISSFYAELLRIKQIVSATKQWPNVFFLLDEIFKGTNSQDRHSGARVLIRQLSKAGALGMVSTHDLELGDLEGESRGKIRNFHFREYYRNDEIHFDYKLRPGISTTRNAMYLIKMAGIEVEGV